jgi:hypothetical protein
MLGVWYKFVNFGAIYNLHAFTEPADSELPPVHTQQLRTNAPVYKASTVYMHLPSPPIVDVLPPRGDALPYTLDIMLPRLAHYY